MMPHPIRTTHRNKCRAFVLACAATALLGTGCVERTIRVTSEPAGARVWLNDRDIGVTPTS